MYMLPNDLFQKNILLYLFLERGEGREEERGRNIRRLPLTQPHLGTWPATQACALPGIDPHYLSFCGMTPNTLSHTGQGPNDLLIITYKMFTVLFLISDTYSFENFR